LISLLILNCWAFSQTRFPKDFLQAPPNAVQIRRACLLLPGLKSLYL
jgi:hypothetical protein